MQKCVDPNRESYLTKTVEPPLFHPCCSNGPEQGGVSDVREAE